MEKNQAIINAQTKTLKKLELLLDKIGSGLDECCELAEMDFVWKTNIQIDAEVYDPKIAKALIQIQKIKEFSIELRAEWTLRKQLKPSNFTGYPYQTIDRGYIVLYNDEIIENFWFPKREHRLIMENYIKRKLDKKEIIHHIDGNKTNNDIDNLQIMTNANHVRLHTKLRTINKKKKL